MPKLVDLNIPIIGWARFIATSTNTPTANSYGILLTYSQNGELNNTAGILQQAMIYGGTGIYSRKNISGGGWTVWERTANVLGNVLQPFLAANASTKNNVVPLGQLLGRQAVIMASGTFLPTYTGQYLANPIGGGGGPGGAAANVAGGSSSAGTPAGRAAPRVGPAALTARRASPTAIGAEGHEGAGGRPRRGRGPPRPRPRRLDDEAPRPASLMSGRIAGNIRMPGALRTAKAAPRRLGRCSVGGRGP